jgi:hypothetical protein
MVHTGGQFPNSIISRLASEDIGYGIAVGALATTDLTMGDQQCELPNVAADANAPLCLGIAIADTSREATAAGAATWVDGDSVSIMKTGQIWVEVETVVASLADSVCIGIATASGGEGSFDNTASATYIACTGMKWIAAETVGSTYWGLIQVDL